MQGNRIAGDARAPWRVRGLGVCDALELRVEAAHLPWLLAELDAMRARREQDSSPEAEYELRLLELMRAPLLRAPVRGTAVVAGPSGLVQEAVDRAAARAPTLEDLAAECRAVVLFNFDPDADPLRAL